MNRSNWIDRRVLRALAEASAEGYGGMRPSRGVAELSEDLDVSEVLVALSLKMAEQSGWASCTSTKQLNKRYVITEQGERELGLRSSLRRTLGRRR